MVCGLVVCVLDSVFFCFVCVGLNWGAWLFGWVFWFFLVFCFFDADDFGTFCFLIVGVCFCWIVFWLEPFFWFLLESLILAQDERWRRA